MQKASDKRIFFKKNILGKNEMSKMSNKKANSKILFAFLSAAIGSPMLYFP